MPITGEAGHHCLYQQDRSTNAGAQTATSGCLLQAAPYCGRNQWLAKVCRNFTVKLPHGQTS